MIWFQKPRVSWCAFTGKWIVNAHGWPHRCGSPSYKADVAFCRWHDAMAEANTIARQRIRSAVAHDVWYGK